MAWASHRRTVPDLLTIDDYLGPAQYALDIECILEAMQRQGTKSEDVKIWYSIGDGETDPVWERRLAYRGTVDK